jgi:hypothetical protein
MSQILTTESLKEYFRVLLEGVIARQRAPLAETTEFYLVDLLSRFSDASALYEGCGRGLEQEPLVMQWKKALEASPAERIRILRHMGDSSLYVAGFFGDSFERKIIDVGYYILMGGMAYRALANISHARVAGGAFDVIYDELCQKFQTIVDLFTEISQKVALSSNQGVLRLYRRWCKTKSRYLARLLAEQGVLPVFTKLCNIH